MGWFNHQLDYFWCIFYNPPKASGGFHESQFLAYQTFIPFPSAIHLSFLVSLPFGIPGPQWFLHCHNRSEALWILVCPVIFFIVFFSYYLTNGHHSAKARNGFWKWINCCDMMSFRVMAMSCSSCCGATSKERDLDVKKIIAALSGLAFFFIRRMRCNVFLHVSAWWLFIVRCLAASRKNPKMVKLLRVEFLDQTVMRWRISVSLDDFSSEIFGHGV